MLLRLPSIPRSKSSHDSRPDPEEPDPLRGIAPMAPLGGRAPHTQPSFSTIYDNTPNMSTVNTKALMAGSNLSWIAVLLQVVQYTYYSTPLTRKHPG